MTGVEEAVLIEAVVHAIAEGTGLSIDVIRELALKGAHKLNASPLPDAEGEMLAARKAAEERRG